MSDINIPPGEIVKIGETVHHEVGAEGPAARKMRLEAEAKAAAEAAKAEAEAKAAAEHE